VDAKLAAEKAGRVVEISAERGQAVTNGEVLLRIDDRVAQAAADAARVNYEDAARNLERFEKLSGTGAVSQKVLDEIRKSSSLADAQLREAEAALSYCTVRSPTDGLVNERYVEEGEYVMPAAPVFDVLSINPVRVTVDIPERNVLSLNSGDTVPFEVISRPGQTFTGTVSYVSSKAEPGNNSFRVELKVPNPDLALRPGMIASVQHRRSIRTRAITLPLEAIIPQKGDNVVYLVRDGHAVRQLVQIDTILKQEALILSGVSAGDLVVTRGNRMLADGAKVKIQE
jgi:membrane fusion protein (multidrug efflux system)